MLICDLCEFQTTVKEKYAGHRSGHVRRGELLKRTPYVKVALHVCKFCNSEFDTGSKLGAHIRIHWSKEKLTKRFSYGGKGVSLRKALFNINRIYECEICKQGSIWNDLPLTLQVDHKDGDNQNHNSDNLRFLCPNCHTQTPTFGSKNRKTSKQITGE